MGLNRLRHAEYVDEALTGVSIRKKLPYDTLRSCPMFESVDPFTWIPDPHSDYVTPARWNFFEREITMRELEELKGKQETEEDFDSEGIDTESQATTSYRNNAQGTSDVNDQTLNKIVSVYQGFSYIEGKLYKVTIDTKFGDLYEFDEIKPVTKEEKKSGKVNMNTCIRISYFSPTR